MSFQYPLGLLALIGVPIIIIIYILKKKYTEQTISSTYLWRLSEKFLKNKLPISKLASILGLVLQILAVVIISLTIAHPVITIPNAANEFCFILDGSASMSMVQNGKTRLELGKQEIKEIINDSLEGSSYTILYLGENTREVCKNETNPETAIELLNGVEQSDLAINCVNALFYAQECFNNNNSILTYLVTDKDYNATNIEVVNVSSDVENYAIVDTTYLIENSKLKITSSVVSYVSAATLNVELYIDDELVSTKSVDVMGIGEVNVAVPVDVEFEYNSINYKKIEVVIKESDSLAKDNTDIIYNIAQEHNNSVLLVSDRPFYINSMLKSLGNTIVTTVSTEKYSTDMTGYGLYIFDSFNPQVLPTDGATWLFGLNSSLEKSGFNIKDDVEVEEGTLLTYSPNKTTLFKTLTANTIGDEIYINKYVKYGLVRNFTTLLYCGSDSVVFAGTNENKQRQIVFAFDLHDSNLAMLIDFRELFSNFIDYSFPTILEEGKYYVGDELTIDVLSDCSSIRIEAPSGNISYMSLAEDVSSFVFKESGTHTITFTFGTSQKEFHVFVKLPENERFDVELDTLETIALQGEASDDYIDANYTKLIIFFICLAVIFVTDWMVYCYEQYQLR